MRRKKSMTYEEELQYLDSEITAAEEKIKEMKARKKELAKEKEQQDLLKLSTAIKESGRSIEEVIALIK